MGRVSFLHSTNKNNNDFNKNRTNVQTNTVAEEELQEKEVTY